MPAGAAERDDRILALRADRKTLQEIADAVGLTRERVRQILLRLGGPSASEVRAATEEHRRAQASAAVERIRADVLQHPATTVEEIAVRLDMRRRDVQALVPDDVRALVVNPASHHDQKWSDDDVLAALAEAGTYCYPLTTAAYARLLNTGEIEGPSVARITQRFGTWAEACQQAGVEAGTSMRSNYQSRWTDDDMLGFVREYLASPGSRGSFNGYDVWRRSHATSAPSSGILRQRLGPWSAVKRRVLEG